MQPLNTCLHNRSIRWLCTVMRLPILAQVLDYDDLACTLKPLSDLTLEGNPYRATAFIKCYRTVSALAVVSGSSQIRW